MRYQIHSHKNQHPGQPRSFTAREYARMQGFPDTHYLCGTHEKKFEQVGNAVCARLALNIGKAMCIGAQADSPLRLETWDTLPRLLATVWPTRSQTEPLVVLM